MSQKRKQLVIIILIKCIYKLNSFHFTTAQQHNSGLLPINTLVTWRWTATDLKARFNSILIKSFNHQMRSIV